jgi:hypothetical protein
MPKSILLRHSIGFRSQCTREIDADYLVEVQPLCRTSGKWQAKGLCCRQGRDPEASAQQPSCAGARLYPSAAEPRSPLVVSQPRHLVAKTYLDSVHQVMEQELLASVTILHPCRNPIQGQRLDWSVKRARTHAFDIRHALLTGLLDTNGGAGIVRLRQQARSTASPLMMGLLG